MKCRTIAVLCLSVVLSQCRAFDLISAILSQTQSLPGRLPVSLAELKSLLTPEIIQKMLQSKLPSLESLKGDPAQIRRILAKLKPMQGRFDPQILEILSNTFPSTQPPSTLPAESYNESQENEHSVKRGILPPHPSSQSQLTRYPGPRPNRILRRPLPPKFSSKFRRRQGQGQGAVSEPERDTTMKVTMTTLIDPSSDSTEAPPPFDHITDPNIRNHRLYGWMHQNFTMIDRAEDLMMDESSSPLPSLISLSSASEEVQSQGTTPSGAPEASSPEEDPNTFPFTPRPREPLRKSSAESGPIADGDNYFRPSAVDVSPPHVFEPGQDFYTSTIRSPPGPHQRGKVPQGKPPYKKQDRILSNGGLPMQNNFGTTPNYRPQRVLYGQDTSGQNLHPFAHYTDRDTMYSPSHYHHNKYHYHNPSVEQNHGHIIGGESELQSAAEDKYDSGWTSTFVLLGGLVAASALVAFILPSFLTTVNTVGKDNNDEVAAAGSEPASNIWHDIKGLYTDLTHIAQGDFSHFNKKTSEVGVGGNEEETKSSTNKVLVVEQESPEEVDLEPEPVFVSSNRGRGRGRRNETEEASSVHPAISANNGTMSPLILLQRNRYSKANNTFLKEWAKVQLQLIDN